MALLIVKSLINLSSTEMKIQIAANFKVLFVKLQSPHKIITKNQIVFVFEYITYVNKMREDSCISLNKNKLTAVYLFTQLSNDKFQKNS